jgi:hypothetical protein
MIAFGCAITEEEPYWRYTEPGIRRAAEDDSEVYVFAAIGSTARSYNLLIDHAAARDDLEALVIVDAHAEIADPGFCAKVRQAAADPDVGVVGCAGARGVRSIAWWEGEVVSAPITLRYQQFGGGQIPAFDWANPAPPPAEVDSVAAFLMVLSPWAVRNVRFDEELLLGPGSEVDFCRTVKEAGRKVTVADLHVVFHDSVELLSEREREVWMQAHAQVARKWEPRMTGVDAADVDWKARARRAEAERESARAASYARGLMTDAHLVELEREMEAITSTASWRWTEPLRVLNAWRAERDADRSARPRRSAA